MQVLTVSNFLSCTFCQNLSKIAFLNVCRFFQKFPIHLDKHERELGFVMLFGLVGEAVERISSYARS